MEKRRGFKKRDEGRGTGDEKRPFKKRFEGRGTGDEKRPFKKRFEGRGTGDEKRPFKKRFEGRGTGDEKRPYKKRFEGRGTGDEKRPFKKRFEGRGTGDEKRPFKKRFEGRGTGDEKRPFKKRFEGRGTGDEKRPYKKRFEGRGTGDEKRPFKKRFEGRGTGDEKRPFKKRFEGRGTGDEKRPYKKRFEGRGTGDEKRGGFKKRFDKREDKPYFKKRFSGKPAGDRKQVTDKEDFKEQKKAFLKEEYKAEEGETRLNKYIAHAGVCSRREADELIAAGAVKVNGQVVTEMGFKVKPGDVVNFGGESLKSERKVYLLLNKPKDVITTTDDPQGRDNVMMLVRKACKERIYPVGRLDRATTGVLLFTNDGELAKVLTHPKHRVPKMYHVVLDKSLTKFDFEAIQNGVKLDDGMIAADVIDYIGDGSNKREIGLEIHSGRNRVVRRMFEQLGYKVTKLDRVMFAGLTKKDVPRGTWRFLTEKEIGFLKMFRPKEES